jgi:hypothetical protein
MKSVFYGKQNSGFWVMVDFAAPLSLAKLYLFSEAFNKPKFVKGVNFKQPRDYNFLKDSVSISSYTLCQWQSPSGCSISLLLREIGSQYVSDRSEGL